MTTEQDYLLSIADNEGMIDMTAETFKDKVDAAISAVMKHAIKGDEDHGYNLYCGNPEHALAILAEHGLSVMNTAQVSRALGLDKKPA